MDKALLHISNQFQIPGKVISIAPYGSGHIHQTYLVESGEYGNPARTILQKVNQTVFSDPIGMMKNIAYVTRHLNQFQLSLTLVPSINGLNYYDHEQERFWRCFEFVEDTQTFESIQNVQQAREAGKAVGKFQNLLLSLPVDPLKETIPNFHNTSFRFQEFHRILNLDRQDRAKDCEQEIEFAQAWSAKCNRLVDLANGEEIPSRITHNDTKINNILFNRQGDKAICMIDLDTVMPGLSLYDFGDLVRTSISTVTEDETDLSKLSLRLDIFQGIAEGYTEETENFLTSLEKQHLVYVCQLLSYETGLRFLTDYLKGDLYFKTSYLNHNLNRCRNQFQLHSQMCTQQDELQNIIQFNCYSL